MPLQITPTNGSYALSHEGEEVAVCTSEEWARRFAQEPDLRAALVDVGELLASLDDRGPHVDFRGESWDRDHRAIPIARARKRVEALLTALNTKGD